MLKYLAFSNFKSLLLRLHETGVKVSALVLPAYQSSGADGEWWYSAMSSLVMLLSEHLLVVTDAALQVREAVQLLLRVVFFIILRHLSRTVVALVLVTPNWLVFFFFVPGVIVQIVEFHSFDLVHLMAVVVPLLGESELTLVLLARC